MNSPAAAESTPHPQYASVRALALKYGVSETTIWRWAQQGRIPAPTKFGPNTTRWDVEAVDVALATAIAAEAVVALAKVTRRRKITAETHVRVLPMASAEEQDAVEGGEQ